MTKKLLGHVGVDSGQLLITDPGYIDSEWEKKQFKNIEIYKHNKLKKIFGYNKSKLGNLKIESFKHYEAKTSTGKTMNEMIENKEVKKIDTPYNLIGTYSYAGICETTLSNQHQINYKKGHKGVGVVFSSGYGDGIYPIYGTFNKEGRCLKVEIDCSLTPVQKEFINSIK